MHVVNIANHGKSIDIGIAIPYDQTLNCFSHLLFSEEPENYYYQEVDEKRRRHWVINS